MFTTRIIGAIAVAATLVVGATACTDERPTSTETLQWTPTGPVNPCPDPQISGSEASDSIITTDPSGATADDLLAYLRSPERVARYEALATKAGPLIADNIMRGTFGDAVTQSDDSFRPVAPDYEGWGDLTAQPVNDEDEVFIGTIAYARAWWNGDGTIDPDKSVQDMSVANAADPGSVGSLVTISLVPSPHDEESTWEAYLDDRCQPITIFDIYTKVKLDGWGAPNPGSYAELPSSLEEVKVFDFSVTTRFEANMDSWNIDGWE